jgi:hypothetical protein
MNKQKMAFQFRLILMGLITISCVGMSCTSLQQTTVATTDDLYYTPNNKETPTKATDVARNENRYNQNDEEQGEYQDYQSYPDDRYLRLKVSNRNRWDVIDDFGYWNDPRFNYSYYPSYGGWNNWYSGFYGSSWFNPFGINMGFGWGGYAPFMSSYYNMGWGYNDFGYGGFGYGGFGYAGLGYGGFGYGGFGYGGWNPYYAGYWNPYAGYYDYYGGYGGFGGGLPGRRIHFQDPRATQTSAPTLASYRNPSTSRNFNNTTNVTTGNTRYTGNSNLNNNFSNLVKRVVTTNSNVNNANSWDRPARSFKNNYNTNQANSNSNNSNTRSNYTPSNNAVGRSGGFSSSSAPATSGRAPRQN